MEVSFLGQSNRFQEDKQYIQGHILKFMQKGRHHMERGIICFPQQTYGNAQQAPEEFKGKHGLVPQNGYTYKHENKPEFKYYSQRRYFSIDGSKNQQESKQIHFEDPQNEFKFHRKKGKLSQFMDKNGWMNKTTKLMGFQRDDKARQLSNKDRARKISALRPKINYENIAAKKVNPSAEYFTNMGTYTSQKMRIRAERNEKAGDFSLSVEPRNIKSSHRPVTTLQRETMQTRMLQTVSGWSTSKVAKTKLDSFNKTIGIDRISCFEGELNNKTNSRQYSWRQNHKETLEDWYRTTCSSKWVYNKKLQSQQAQQAL